MKKSDKGKKIFGVFVILVVITSVFGGVVSAEDVSGGLKQSVDDAEIQTAAGNLSSEKLTEALDAVTDDTVNIEFADQSAGLEVVSSRSSYDRQAAYNYAQKYWNKVCSDGCFWDQSYPPTCGLTPGAPLGSREESGVDCAHFVSCCIGNEPNEKGGGLDVDTRVPPAYGEPGAQRLRDWLLNNDVAEEVSSLSQVEKGDVIFYDLRGTDNVDHSAFYLGNGKIATHSWSYWDKNWDIYDGYHDKFNPKFIHISTQSVQKPTVETRSATSITETAATLNGEITDDGGASIDERGLLWGEGDTLTELTKDVTISGNHFSFCLTGLKPDTKYSFMAYAKNSAGTGEGNILSFRTECPTPGTPSNPSPSNHAPDVSINSDLYWSDCSNTDSYDVYFGTSSPPPLYGVAPTSTTPYYPVQIDLEYGIKYYWKIVAKSNCGGITQGPIWDFNTEENPNTCDGTDTSCGIYPNCENCNDHDGWYCNGNTREYRNFYCSGTSCADTVTSSDNCNNYDGCSAYSNGCENRDYYCSGGSCVYTHSNRHTDYYDDWDYYCDGDTVRKHRLFHNYYCDGGTCTDHTSMVDDQLVENCNDHDGWVDTGNTDWVPDPGNDCREKELKEQKYRDYYCSDGACTYSVTDTQWVDTGTMQNKPDDTICDCTARNTLKRCDGGVCTDTGICDATTCGADATCDGKRPGDSCSGGICNSNCKCGGQAVGEDIAVFRNGKWYVDTTGNHAADLIFTYGFAGSTPLVGNFGSEDIAVVSHTSKWYVDTDGDRAADQVFMYGFAGSTPLVGDFDGVGNDDIAVFCNGKWWVDINGDHAADLIFTYGFAGSTPLVGDINQDGTDDIAVFCNGKWWVDTTGDHAADLIFMYGFAGSTPLVGDFNQDGTGDIAVFCNGKWWVDTTGDHAADLIFTYGFAGSTPLVGNIG